MSNHTIFTPRPVGSTPHQIERLASDEHRDYDEQRLHLAMTTEDERRRKADPDKRFVFTDQRSGNQFLYLGRASCGAGCRCAAEAVWIGTAA